MTFFYNFYNFIIVYKKKKKKYIYIYIYIYIFFFSFVYLLLELGGLVSWEVGWVMTV